MSHKHQQIRDAVVDLLADIQGIRVYGSVFSEIPKEKLPIISVYTNNESAVRLPSIGGYTRTVTVVVAVYVTGFDAAQIADKNLGETNINDKLDNLKAEVEGILLKKFQTLDKIIFQLDYAGVDVSYPTAEEAKVYAVAKMRYNAIYHQEVN
jgi:hypothetical protein